MANCKFIINIAGQMEPINIGSFDPNNIRSGQTKLDLLADFLTNKTDRDRFVNKVTESLLGVSTISHYNEEDVYVPTHTWDEFIDEFGSQYDVLSNLEYKPDVKIIDDESTIDNINGLFIQKVIQGGKSEFLNQMPDLYIVPRSLLRNFVNHIKAVSKTMMIGSTDIENLDEEGRRLKTDLESIKREFDDYKNQIVDNSGSIRNSTLAIRRNIDIELRGLYTRLDNYISKLRKDIETYDTPLISLSKKAKALRDINSDIREINNRLRKINAYKFIVLSRDIPQTIGISEDDEYTKSIMKTLNDINDAIDAARKEFRSEYSDKIILILKSSRKNEALTNINNKRLKDMILSIDMRKDIISDKISYDDPKDLVLDMLRNKDEMYLLLSNNVSLYLHIVDFVYQTIGYASKFTSKNKVVNALNVLLAKGPLVDKNEVIKILLQNGYNVQPNSDSDLFKVLTDEFVKNQHNYLLYNTNIKEKTILFSKRKDGIANIISKRGNGVDANHLSELSAFVSEVFALKPIQVFNEERGVMEDMMYKGYYIYQLPQQDAYVYSLHRLTRYFDLEIYNSIQDIKIAIDNEGPVNLSTQNSVFLYNIDGNYDKKSPTVYTIKLPNTGIRYYIGLILETIDLENVLNDIGEEFNIPSRFPLYFTTGMYNNWLQQTFNSEDLRLINESIITPDLKALFYRLMRDKINYFKSDTEEYSEYKTKVLLPIVEQISKAKKKYFIVTQSNFGYNDDFIRIQPVTQLASSIVNSKAKKLTTKIPIIEWSAYKHVFELNGVKVNLLKREDLIKMGVDPSTKGFILDGIIYININEATPTTPFHEYTHLLLGILQNTNPDLYYELLNEFGAIVDRNEKLKIAYDDIEKRYSEVAKSRGYNEQLSRMLYLEELFADEYGRYLQLTPTDINDIFSKVSKEVLKSPIFDEGVTERDLFKNATNQYGIFERLSSAIANAKSRVGYGFSLILSVTHPIESERLGVGVTDSEFSDEILQSKDNGLYKLCK